MAKEKDYREQIDRSVKRLAKALNIIEALHNELLAYRESISPDELIKHFRLREPRFAEMCRNGLFT